MVSFSSRMYQTREKKNSTIRGSRHGGTALQQGVTLCERSFDKYSIRISYLSTSNRIQFVWGTMVCCHESTIFDRALLLSERRQRSSCLLHCLPFSHAIPEVYGRKLSCDSGEHTAGFRQCRRIEIASRTSHESSRSSVSSAPLLICECTRYNTQHECLIGCVPC